MRAVSCLAILFVAVALSGCATNRAAKNLRQYVEIQKPRAQAGMIQWSSYYRGLYGLASAAGAPGDTLGRMNEAIRDAEQFEAGAITESEFEYRQRALGAADRSAQQQRAQQAQQNSAARMAIAAQLMQASGPRTLSPPSTVASPVGTIMGVLESDSENGMLRYCRYSNGVVTTIRITDLCPLNTK